MPSVHAYSVDDIKVARNIRFVVKEGVAHYPKTLLLSAEGKVGPADIGIFAVAIGLVAYPFVTFKHNRVASGTAYGFTAAESVLETHEPAIRQLESGRVEAFELGEGSGALSYSGDDLERAASFELGGRCRHGAESGQVC